MGNKFRFNHVKLRPTLVNGFISTNYSLVDNAKSNCGIGPGGFQPGNKCAKGGGSGVGRTGKPKKTSSSSIPDKIEHLEVIKNLGGTTGAKLVRDPTTGKNYVLKQGGGSNPGAHITNEFNANKMYRELGVPVPNSKLIVSKDGKPSMLSEYIEGTPLKDLSGSARQKAFVKLREDFAIDATMANWDVIGASEDNIIVSKDGTPYRIDNGGALGYRAQGAQKSKEQWNSKNEEIDTMRNSPSNPSSKAVFGIMSDAEVLASFEKHKIAIKQSTTHLAAADAKQVQARFDNGYSSIYMTSSMSGWKTEEAPSLVSMTATHFSSGASVKKHVSKYAASVSGMNSTTHSKIEFLNPNGLTSGTFLVPSTTTPGLQEKQLNFLSKHLPPGTKIQVVHTPSVGQLKKQGLSKKKPLQEIEAEGSNFKTPKSIDKTIPTPTPTSSGSSSSNPLPKSPAKIKPGEAGGTKPLKPDNVNADSFPGSKTIEFGTVSPTGVETGSKIKTISDTAKVDKAQVEHVYHNELTNAERQRLGSWKGSARATRKAIASGDLDSSHIEFLNMVDKMPVYAGTVFRGVHHSSSATYTEELITLLATKGPGNYWRENVPSCSSRNAATAKHFAEGALLLKVHTKGAAYVGPVNSHYGEDEVILKPGRNYKITRVVKNARIDDTDIELYAELEEV